MIYRSEMANRCRKGKQKRNRNEIEVRQLQHRLTGVAAEKTDALREKYQRTLSTTKPNELTLGIVIK